MSSPVSHSDGGAEVPLAGVYDPARQLYNWKPTNTRAWRRAVARTWTGGTGRINCFGNSTTAGYTYGGRSEWNAWPSYLRRLLAQRYGDAGSGVVYFMEPDWRVNASGGWARDHYGPFGASCWWTNSDAGALTFGPVWASGFRVTYLTAPGAGILSPVSDVPGQWASFTNTSAAFGVGTVAVPAGPLGYHTLTIRTGVPGTAVFVLGVEALVRGISVTNVGRGSTVAANLTGGDPWLDSSLKTAIDANPSDLAIVAYVENSPGYQLPEAMKADYRVLLDRIRASGSDILLMTSIDWEGEGTTTSPMLAPQADYNTAVYELADEYDVPVFDVADRWGKYEDAPGYYADRIHPSPMGYADIGAGLYSILHTGI